MADGIVRSKSNENRPRSHRTSMLVQPFAQHEEIVQPLAVIPQAVAVLTHQRAKSGGVQPAAIAQALTFRQLVAPRAGRPTGEPHLERDGEGVLGSPEQIGREKSCQQRLEERLSSIPIQEPVVREPQRDFQHFVVQQGRARCQAWGPGGPVDLGPRTVAPSRSTPVGTVLRKRLRRSAVRYQSYPPKPSSPPSPVSTTVTCFLVSRASNQTASAAESPNGSAQCRTSAGRISSITGR